MNAPILLGDDTEFEAAATSPSGSAFRIQRLLAALRKYWWLPVVTVPVCLAAAVAYVVRLPPTYISSASMWETAKLHVPGAGLFAEDVQNFLATQTELLESESMRELTLASLRSAVPKVRIPRTKNGGPLRVKIRVTGGKSSVFVIEATCSDEGFAQTYLTALMDVYLDYKRRLRNTISGGTLDSIARQIERTELELKNQQDILLAFEKTNNLANLRQDGAMAGGYLATLKTKLSDLELEDRLIQASLAQQDAGATNRGGDPAPFETLSGGDALSSDPVQVLADSKELEILESQRAKLSKFLRPKHPKIVKIDEAIARAKNSIEIYRRQNRQQLIASGKNIELRLQHIRAAIKEYDGKFGDLNILLAESERLKLNVSRQQGIYDRLTMMQENLSISRNLDQENLAVLDPAKPATRSYSQEKSVLASGGLGGLMLGVGFIVLIGIRDDRFASVAEVKEHFGALVMGQVPTVAGLKLDESVPLLEIDDPRHAYAESFRSLRSALFFMATETERPQVLLITSAVPHEGKSTVAANLARTLALGGAKVILVDGDLRKGALHKVMGLPYEPGLADLLRRPGDLDRVVQANTAHNLAFIPRGCVSSNARDLFLGEALDQIVALLRRQFDYVLIDGSPVFASDDANTLAPQVDGTLFVVRSRFSSRKPVREALEQLYQRRARVLGVIFNQADASAKSYYQYKYEEYYASAKAE